MLIETNGELKLLGFWPSDEIHAAFKRVNAATGKENEVEEMRLFVRTMNYFLEQAEEEKGEIGGPEIKELCRLAKIGLNTELGITA